METHIKHFDDLLRAARARPERQRLLFMFAGAELPSAATSEQRQRFQQGEGGALTPLMCVDKLPEELDSFAALLGESQQFELPGQPWRLVFTAALAGSQGAGPSDSDVERALNHMMAEIKAGRFSNYLPFNREGLPVRLR